MFGLMEEPMKDNGKRISCMVMVCTLGQMVECMKVNTKMTSRKVMVFMSGKMERNMKVNGSMENNMEMAKSSTQKVKVGKEFGKMETESLGWIRKIQCLRIPITEKRVVHLMTKTQTPIDCFDFII